MDCSREPSNFSKFTDELHHAYQEYLGTPTLIIGGFILLGLGMAVLEQAQIPAIDGLRQRLSVLIFGDVESTREILISSAATLITITSITFTVLLLAVQQAASSMTTQIIDQFLRRPINQIMFGYFVGMSIYSLITLAAVRSDFSPVLSTALALIFSAISLYFLAALVYITLTQMRPTVVIHAIHDETLKARKRQLALTERTRRTPCLEAATNKSLRSRGDGYIDHVQLAPLEKALMGFGDQIEVVLKVRIGSYVARGDEVAEIRTVNQVDTGKLEQTVLRALRLTRARDLQHDAAHGVEQIMNIGWTSISSAQHNPSAGAQSIHALRNLLSEWSMATEPVPHRNMLPIVYDDNVMILPLRGIESLAVAAVESRQHQSFGHVLQTIAVTYERLPRELRVEAEAMILRILPGLKNQIFTTALDEALHAAATAFEAAGRPKVAEAIRKMRTQERVALVQLTK